MLVKARKFLNRPIFRYSAGVGAVLVALFLRETLTASLGPDFPEYLLFYPAVMLVALLAGFWPAILAIVVAALMIFAFWFLPGRTPLLHIGASNYIGLALFTIVCGFLSLVAELYRRSRQKAAAYDRQKAERETQEALLRQAEMLKLSFDAVIVWRAGGVVESWNRGAEELYGYSEAEATGRSIDELAREPGDGSRDAIDTALRAAGEWFGEVRHLTKDGGDVVVSSRQLIRRGLDGVERVLEIDRDITAKKRIEEQLQSAHDELEKEVERRTADLQKANRALIMVSACDQALVQISDRRELMGVVCQIIQDEGGYPLVWVGLRGELEETVKSVAAAGGQDGFVESVVTAGGAAALSEGPVGDAMRSKAPAVSGDISGPRTPPAWREAALARKHRSIAAFPLLNADKEAIGALVIHSGSDPGFEQRQVVLFKELADDLAFGIVSLQARADRDLAQHSLELKAAQLQTLTGELVRTEQRERQRIAQLLHDQVQQLLVATLYGLDGLHGARPVEEYGQVAQRLSGLVRECIAVTRSLASELSHPAFTEPHLCTALGWLGAWMKERHDIEVAVQCADSVLEHVEESRVTLLQAVRELLFNVVKHAGVREARVDLVRRPDGNVEVCVGDEGKGFDAVAVLTPSRGSGGIGLFSIRERLEMIGGGMAIESAPGSGTRVKVWVPHIEMTVPERRKVHETGIPTPSLPDASPGSAGRIRVVLVDDHAVVREGIALQLGRHSDVEIVGEASDGQQAIELVRALRPDVVTMDVNMPGMSGVEAARIIHAEHPRTRIIGLSMSEDSEQGAAMREAGAVRYLSKSASPEKLLAAIRDSSDSE